MVAQLAGHARGDFLFGKLGKQIDVVFGTGITGQAQAAFKVFIDGKNPVELIGRAFIGFAIGFQPRVMQLTMLDLAEPLGPCSSTSLLFKPSLTKFCSER